VAVEGEVATMGRGQHVAVGMGVVSWAFEPVFGGGEDVDGDEDVLRMQVSLGS
jgi:hypothetical protein